ncbi:MAG TPA: hypothetical protein V6C65_36625 [Allocoleopsis sp.]
MESYFEKYRGYDLSILKDDRGYHCAVKIGACDPDISDRPHSSFDVALSHAKKIIELLHVAASGLEQFDNLLEIGAISPQEHERQIEWLMQTIEESKVNLSKLYAR